MNAWTFVEADQCYVSYLLKHVLVRIYGVGLFILENDAAILGCVFFLGTRPGDGDW